MCSRMYIFAAFMLINDIMVVLVKVRPLIIRDTVTACESSGGALLLMAVSRARRVNYLDADSQSWR